MIGKTTSSSDSARKNLRGASTVAIALQSAGTLSALVFLISSTDELLWVRNLYVSQQFLIGLLVAFSVSWLCRRCSRIPGNQAPRRCAACRVY